MCLCAVPVLFALFVVYKCVCVFVCGSCVALYVVLCFDYFGVCVCGVFKKQAVACVCAWFIVWRCVAWFVSFFLGGVSMMWWVVLCVVCVVLCVCYVCVDVCLCVAYTCVCCVCEVLGDVVCCVVRVVGLVVWELLCVRIIVVACFCV